MTSIPKPASRAQLKQDFCFALNDFKWACYQYDNKTPIASEQRINSAYTELQRRYYLVCPHRDPVSALIHRIRQAVIRVWERFSSFCNGEDGASTLPSMTSKEIRREFRDCGVLHRFYLPEPSSSTEDLPPFTRAPAKTPKKPAAPTKSKRAAPPPPAPSTVAPSLASQGIPAVGICNPSANCWVIALFQIIAHTPSLKDMYLSIARALQNGPNPENAAYFNELADRYAEYSGARQQFLTDKRTEHQTSISSHKSKLLTDIETKLPTKCFCVPKDWNPPPPAPASDPSSPTETAAPAPISEPPLPSEEETKRIKRQAHAFKKVLREKIAKEQETLTKQCRTAWERNYWGSTDWKSVETIIYQTCQQSLQRAWAATCADKTVPHLSQKTIDLYVKPTALCYRLSGTEETEHVYETVLTEILEELSPLGFDLKPTEKLAVEETIQVESKLATTREQAIEMARVYGLALERALNAYDDAVERGEHFLPGDISQDIRLAWHFMTPPSPDNPLDRPITQSASQQADPHEAFVILYNAYSYLMRNNPKDLACKIIRSKTFERRPDLPLLESDPIDPVRPQKPRMRGLTLSTSRYEEEGPTIENPTTHEEVTAAQRNATAATNAELQVVTTQIRQLQQQTSQLQTLQRELVGYREGMSKYLEDCGLANRKRNLINKTQEKIARTRAVLSNPEPAHEPIGPDSVYDKVDSESVVKPEQSAYECYVGIHLPQESPGKVLPPTPFMPLLEAALFKPIKEGTTTTYAYENDVFIYQMVSEQLQFDGFPPHLIFHCIRFSSNADPVTGRTVMHKNETALEVPLTFQLPEGAVLNIPSPAEEGSPPVESPEYALEGFFVHSTGIDKNINSGHYIAYWKDSGTQQWIEGNDGTTRIISEAEVLNAAASAYMLFYRNTAIPQENALPETPDVPKE